MTTMTLEGEARRELSRGRAQTKPGPACAADGAGPLGAGHYDRLIELFYDPERSTDRG
jgi:hypothetical protein